MVLFIDYVLRSLHCNLLCVFSQGTSALCVWSALRNMSLTAAWCNVPDVHTGSIPNVRGSQVRCVHFQCLADPTHSTLSCISFLSFSSSDDLYEILCRLRGKSLVFSCAPCSKRFRSGWQDVVQVVLRNGLEKIMDGLRSSPNICHLLVCAQVRFEQSVYWEYVPFKI